MAENNNMVPKTIENLTPKHNLFRAIKKVGRWQKILLLLMLFLIAVFANKHFTQKIHFKEGMSNKKNEGIEQDEKFVQKEGNEVYDRFYCNVYDGLVKDRTKNRFEIDEILKLAGTPAKNNKLLDIGSGTGHHVKDFTEKGFKALGVDKSPHMIAKARKNYPRLEYIEGDVTQSISFPSQEFTHITCLYFTIYNIQNKSVFFQNCYNWLVPGGTMILHLVDRDKFDPIINRSNPITILNVQNYAHKRITNSVVKFKGLTYKANFEQKAGDDISYFDEHMKDDTTGNIRKNRHILYMENKKEILDKAQKTGFKISNQSNMKTCHYDNQYLYFLRK